MKRIFVLAMIAMFLFVPLSHADVKTALTADGNQALFSLLFNENKESSVSTQGDAEAASTIPRIGGNWNSTGAGTIGGERFTTRGTASVVSYIDSDGYEVITHMSEVHQIYDAQGSYVGTERPSWEVILKITSRSFYTEEDGIRDAFSIESDSRVTRRRTGLIQGYPIDATWVYTRGSSGGGSSSGGGCSAGNASPFAVLLTLPLFFLYRRK
jgi:Synergist-CTERM protein sorting domain-containing protein